MSKRCPTRAQWLAEHKPATWYAFRHIGARFSEVRAADVLAILTRYQAAR